MEVLTDRQNEILDTIKKFMAKNGYPPTVREIGAILNLSSPATTHFHLDRLERKGYIRKDKAKNRTIELLVPNEYSQKEETALTVPLLTTNTKDNHLQKLENPIEFFSIPKSLAARNKLATFALRAKGNAMINKGIQNEDIVIMEKEDHVSNGEMVAVITNENEILLRTYYKENNRVRLQPENDTMTPLILDKVTILGKVVGLYRKF